VFLLSYVFLLLKRTVQNMLQFALANCVEQIRDIIGLFTHNNLTLADKLVDINYREKSEVNSDLLRIAED